MTISIVPTLSFLSYSCVLYLQGLIVSSIPRRNKWLRHTKIPEMREYLLSNKALSAKNLLLCCIAILLFMFLQVCILFQNVCLALISEVVVQDR